MAKRTPTTEYVRSVYGLCPVERHKGGDPNPNPAYAEAQFDRWLDAHDREVAERVWNESVDTLSRHWEDVAPAVVADLERRNPYREGGAS